MDDRVVRGFSGVPMRKFGDNDLLLASHSKNTLISVFIKKNVNALKTC